MLFKLLLLLLPMSLFLSPDKKQEITIVFRESFQLEKKAPVKLKGLPIGEVRGVGLLHDSLVAVTIEVMKGVRIPVNSTFSVEGSILSSSYISVTTSSEKKYLFSGDTVWTVKR